MNTDNIILKTDSYKLTHWKQYPEGTQTVYSYFEAREGAKYPYTVFFGLQHILKTYLEGQVVTQEKLDEAYELAKVHFGDPSHFNYAGWQHIIDNHAGKLPVRIMAVPEGTPVENSNVLMTVENTDPECFWLTNALESLLTHVWYSSTVATQSHTTRSIIANFLEETGCGYEGLPFMLHDFGYRGATTDEAAAIGGAAHLVNFMGTDTLPAMLLALDSYHADLDSLAFSVPATEHSVMTARGADGEREVVEQLLREYQGGILSIVADSYNIYDFATMLCEPDFRHKIIKRDGKVVVRPDSGDPEEVTVKLAEILWNGYGGTTNQKGYRVLDSNVGLLWGDGIDPAGVAGILRALERNGFAASNMVFGMGGALLQKVNRDTQRFAFKCSAQKRDGQWHDVFKDPIDGSKKSKRGRLRLVHGFNGNFHTLPRTYGGQEDLLRPVFEDGKVMNELSFDQVRANARALA